MRVARRKTAWGLTRIAVLAAIAAATATVAAGAALAAETAVAGSGFGTLRGVVMDGGEPAAGAIVQVIGALVGASANEHGEFVIPRVPVGERVLRVARVGSKESRVTVVVRAGENPHLRLKLGPQDVKTIPVIDVFGTRLVDKTKTRISTEYDHDEIMSKPVDGIVDIIGLTTGIVVEAGELHIKGGRDGEGKFTVDGITVAGALDGRAPEIATASIETAEIVTGGMNAEQGDVLSGMFNLTTREGGERFGGDIQWHTDRYGENTKTFNNFDRLTLGLGGPVKKRVLTWFASLEGVFSDTYLKSGASRSRYHVLDFIRLGNRQSNDVRGSAKLAWRPNPDDKLTFEVLGHRGVDTPYNHMWSRQGYVSVTHDTVSAQDGSTSLVPVYGRWSFFPEDSTYVPENLADHVPTTTSGYEQQKLVWTNGVGKLDVVSVRLSRFRFSTETAVQGKEPWEYDTQQPFFWAGNSEVDPYFATHGDFPVWTKQSATTWVGKADWTTAHWKGHQAKVGVEGAYNEIANHALQFPNQENGGQPGLVRSQYVAFQPQASAFAQDRWEYEGLVLNAGLRYDMFTPGAAVANEDLPKGRYKQQVSPRLGVAYPISDRDVLSFHYGWTFQTPARNFVFENRGSDATTVVRGNPDLEPETNVAYQAAVQHGFSKDVVGQFSVFFKDIFGLISVRQEVDEVTGLLVPVFVNRDYASARGFETSIRKRFSHRLGAEVNYTYSLATGVASDPNAGLLFAQGGQLYLPIAEQSLDWDQRHTLNANVILRQPGKWGLNFLWTFGSGLPYTPTFRNDRKPDPRFTNTRRLPSASALTIQADKYARIWGQDVTFFVDARNVLDAVSIINLAPASFPNPFVDQVGNDYSIYYTETGRAGGAYLRDTNGDRVEDWVPVHDPRVYGEGRNIRVGIGVAI